jgi:hypothetical protein
MPKTTSSTDCPWCRCIETNRFWIIPMDPKGLCPPHELLWPVAAGAALGFVTNAITRAKALQILVAVKRDGARVCGMEIVPGQKGPVLKKIEPPKEE